jgi:tyrosyl-tRNA synthetase
MLTEIERDEIEALDAARASDPGARASQKRLAEWTTELLHGAEGLAAAQRATHIFFGAEIDRLSDAELGDIFADVPSRELPKSRLAEGLEVLDAFVEAGLAKSRGEAKRTIEQGGAYVNNRRVGESSEKLGPNALASESVMVLRTGKKKYALLRFTA